MNTKLTALALLLAASVSAQAATVVYNITLDGSQEATPNASTATGTAQITLDDVSGAVSITGNYSGLSGTISGSHLHGLAASGSNAGVIFALSNSGGTSGTFTGSNTLSAANLQGMLDGLTYVNLHSPGAFAGGEIRGQVVPEPGVLALASLSIGALLLRRRRR